MDRRTINMDISIIECIAVNPKLKKEINKIYTKNKKDIYNAIKHLKGKDRETYEYLVDNLCCDELETDILKIKVIQIGYVSRTIIEELLIKGWPNLYTIISNSEAKGEVDIYYLLQKQQPKNTKDMIYYIVPIMYFCAILGIESTMPEEKKEVMLRLMDIAEQGVVNFSNSKLYLKYKDEVEEAIKHFDCGNGITGIDYEKWVQKHYKNLSPSFTSLEKIGRCEIAGVAKSKKISKQEFREIIAIYYYSKDMAGEEFEIESLYEFLKYAVRERFLQLAYTEIKKKYFLIDDTLNIEKDNLLKDTDKIKEENRELHEKIKEMKFENNRLRKSYKVGLEKEIAILQKEVDKSSEEVRFYKERVNQLENVFDSISIDSPDMLKESDVDLNEYNIVLIGGNDLKIDTIKWISGYDTHSDLNILLSADYVFFNIMKSSHAVSYRLISFVRRKGLDLHYLTGTNDKLVSDKMKYIINSKLQSDSSK